MVGQILFHVSTVQFIPRCEPNNRTYDWPQAQLQSSSRITNLTHECRIWVNYGLSDHVPETSVDPPTADGIAASRKSAVPCQIGTHAAQQFFSDRPCYSITSSARMSNVGDSARPGLSRSLGLLRAQTWSAGELEARRRWRPLRSLATNSPVSRPSPGDLAHRTPVLRRRHVPAIDMRLGDGSPPRSR